MTSLFLDLEFTIGGFHTLHHHQGVFYEWKGAAYSEVAEADIRAKLYWFLDQCGNSQTGENVNPDAAVVAKVLDALRARAQLDSSISAPACLDECDLAADDMIADDMIACRNGLLHLPTLKMLPHTPFFSTLNAVAFAFDPDASNVRASLPLTQSSIGVGASGPCRLSLTCRW